MTNRRDPPLPLSHEPTERLHRKLREDRSRASDSRVPRIIARRRHASPHAKSPCTVRVSSAPITLPEAALLPPPPPHNGAITESAALHVGVRSIRIINSSFSHGCAPTGVCMFKNNRGLLAQRVIFSVNLPVPPTLHPLILLLTLAPVTYGYRYFRGLSV